MSSFQEEIKDEFEELNLNLLQEIKEMTQRISADDVTHDSLLSRLFNLALAQHQHILRIFDERIQQIEQYMEEIKERRHERKVAAATASTSGSSNTDTTKTSGISSGKFRTRQTNAQSENIIDLNEPIYCICHDVSYGKMVACDNPYCEIEWFHFGCVGLKTTPVGQWYCPDCGPSQKHKVNE